MAGPEKFDRSDVKLSEVFIRKIKNDRGLTEFEKKVLLATLEIPRGETRSYAWVASRINSPKAARAVGNALNKNPYAPDVPCHRVIASSGSPGGYARGIKEKIRLLGRENAKEARGREQ
jgi:O-6-methylguanine DNA methyltransferase